MLHVKHQLLHLTSVASSCNGSNPSALFTPRPPATTTFASDRSTPSVDLRTTSEMIVRRFVISTDNEDTSPVRLASCSSGAMLFGRTVMNSKSFFVFHFFKCFTRIDWTDEYCIIAFPFNSCYIRN